MSTTSNRTSMKIHQRGVVVTTSSASDKVGLTDRLRGSIRILGIVSGQAFTVCDVAQAVVHRQSMMLLSIESKIKHNSAIIVVICWCIHHIDWWAHLRRIRNRPVPCRDTIDNPVCIQRITFLRARDGMIDVMRWQIPSALLRGRCRLRWRRLLPYRCCQ